MAISVTTVPAAANAAVAFSYGDYQQTWGSAEQLLLNLPGIVLAGTLTLLLQKALWAGSARRSRRPSTRRSSGRQGPYADRLRTPTASDADDAAQPSADFTTSASRPATDRACSMSAASTMTRTSGSVPDGRSSTRPVAPSSRSASVDRGGQLAPRSSPGTCRRPAH